MDLSKRDISQTEINRRKKVSAVLTRTTSGAGLAAAGTLVAGAAAPKLVGTKAGKLLKLTEVGTKKFKESTSSKAGVATIAAGGVAGLNGFNNATIQSGEAKQRKRNAVKKPVIKSASPFEEGYFGEVSKYYDPEGNRKKRADLYENAAAAGAGAAGAGAIHQGVQANRSYKEAKSKWGGKDPKTVFLEKPYKEFKVKRGRAAALGAGAAAAAYGAKKIHDKKDASWQPYAKALGGTPGMGAMRAAPAAAKFKPLGQRPVSANVKNMRKVPLANGGGPSGGGGGGVGNTAGLSGVGKSYDEIEKLGSPKARYQEINGFEHKGNSTTKHPADKVTAHYEGKSLILRRPKYQAVGSPSDFENKKSKGKGHLSVTVTRNMRLNAEGGRRIHDAYQGKKKKINLGQGDAKFAIGKDADFGAFND